MSNKNESALALKVIGFVVVVFLFLFFIGDDMPESKATMKIPENIQSEVLKEPYYEVTRQQQEIIDETINNVEIIIEQYKHDKKGIEYKKSVSFNKEKEGNETYFKNEFLKINSKYLIKKNESKEEKIIFAMKIYKHEIGNTCYALLKQMDEKGLIYGIYKEIELNDTFNKVDGKYVKLCNGYLNQFIAFNIN